MATYGLKFELFFQDLEDRRFKLEFHKKNYTGTVSALVGGGNPVEIEWSGDDDIYSPIRGSRCKINLMVTSTTSYDAFHEGDEREYLVKVLKHDSYGYFWESEETEWELVNANWDEDTGGDAFWEPIWQGYLVVDRFKEQMIHKPFPIKLEAIDGLGTLGGFNSPFDRGMWQNLVEFAQFRCFGYLRPAHHDWPNQVEIPKICNFHFQTTGEDKCCNSDREPLLNV